MSEPARAPARGGFSHFGVLNRVGESMWKPPRVHRAELESEVAHIHRKLDFVISLLTQTLTGETNIMTMLDDLKSQEAATEAAIDRAIAVIQDDAAKIADLAAKLAAVPAVADDSAALAELAASLKAKTDALNAVVSPPAPAAAPADSAPAPADAAPATPADAAPAPTPADGVVVTGSPP